MGAVGRVIASILSRFRGVAMGVFGAKSLVKRWMSILVASVLLHVSPAGAQVWYSTYVESNQVGRVTACIAMVEYSNASFVVRLYEEEMDFFFRRDDFALPFRQEMGTVRLSFDGFDYWMIAYSGAPSEGDRSTTTNLINLVPNREDYAALFDALRQSSTMYIVFPNGQSYPVTLRGSSAALSGASQCWATRPTGVYGTNPFEYNALGVNPFR